MCWEIAYIILIVSSTLIAYISAIQIEKHREKIKKKIYLALCICFNLGLLFAFKYFNFFNDTVHSIFSQFNIFYNIPAFKVLLPVGISFYTFQIISYMTDVYRGTTKAEKHLGVFALFVSFFPQLVAGPIERSKNLLPQFFEKHNFDYERFRSGLLLIMWGFFKKVVIADRLAIFVNSVYNNPTDYTGMPLILGTICFGFQVYCDFSGYCDIAIGSARVMGFRLTDNFNRPFASKSVSEFWSRWHITLSSWMRDYVYYPIVFNKKFQGTWVILCAVMISFTLIGLWHGANWTFIIVGILQGAAICYEILTKKIRNKLFKNIPERLYSVLCIFCTFFYLCFTIIFFRARNISDAFYIVKNLFVNITFSEQILVGLNTYEFSIAVIAILVMEGVQFLQKQNTLAKFIYTSPRLVRWTLYYALIFSIILLGEFNQTVFIYFQF